MVSNKPIAMDDRLTVRIDKETKSTLMQLAREKGTDASSVVLQLIRQYLEQGDAEFPELRTIGADVEALKLKVSYIEKELLGKLPA